MLFVKLLAVVKWVKSSKKFESCAAICYLLDQQSQYFVETADRLVTISREELVMARLPAFQVTAAVDVLTQGTYQHLPTIIKDRFVLKPKISAIDEANVLLRLNQVLQYRISKAASTLSPRAKGIVIKNGMLILTVPGEFEVNLTVLGEREQTPWTLLNIKMLVEDYEIGYGAQLVHPLQLHMLHNVLQSRMDVAKNPINEAYTFLHTFAQSLQLDVLFCQASQLAAGRLRNKIVIEKYDPKERILSIGYWVQRIAKRMIGNVRLVPQYRVTIFGDAGDDTSLKVRHYPIAPDLGQLDDRTGRLSIDRLLSETLVVRCRERLLRIRKRLKAAKPLSIVLYAGSATPCLWLPLLRDSVDTREECVVISVNMFSGRVLCNLDAIEFLPGSASELKELEMALYDGQSIDTLRKRIDRLKVLLMIERYRRSVSTLQVRIINENQMAPFFKKVAVSSLPTDRICLQFIKEEHFFLVITFVSNENLTVKMNLYLLCTLDDKVQMMELNKEKQLISAPIDGVVDIEAKTFGQSEYDDVWTLKEKHSRVEPSMVRQLTTAVAAVDDRISFMRVCEELDKKRIGYRSVEEEPHVGGLILHITDVSAVVDVRCAAFLRNMARCCLRLDSRARVIWPLECCMVNIPLVRDLSPYKKGRKTGVWVHEQTGISVGGPVDTIATSIIERLTRYSHIYDTVNRFAKAYDAHYNKFCNVQAYTFHKLVIAYGRERDQQLIVSFRPRNASNDRFNLNFGQFHLMPINEVTLRLTYGHIHLEFIMLSGDTVAIRDSSRNNPRCAGLHQFFHLLSNGTSKSCKENEPRFMHSSSPIQPASLPPNIVDASPAGLSLSASLSVPPNSDAAAVSPAMLGSSAELETSSAPVVIDHDTLRRAFVYVKIPGTNLMRAPLDDYLSALCFIKKLTLAFEAHKRNQSAGRFPFSEMRCGLDFVRISIPVAVPPQTQRTDASAPQTPQQIGGIVSFNFHLDSNTLTLKLNVEYSRNAPPPNDIATLERYFELVVCRLNNELAVFSFINLCRMVANGAVSGIAHVMNAQMDPSPSTYWNVSIQLVCLARDQANASARRYQFGTVFDANNVNALLLICFRPSRATSPRSNEKHLLRIVYNMQTNTVKQHGSEDEALSSILSACSQEAARTGECPLWPAIRQCLDKVSSANVAGMPASVGYMPGSVGGPVSVGPVGSVGMGHNPGSIANPGSNT
ncbi:mediator complex subunit MED14 [Ostertagia ostertagi]